MLAVTGCGPDLMRTSHPTLHPPRPLWQEVGVLSSSSDPFGPMGTLDVTSAMVVCIRGRRHVYRDMVDGRREDTHLQVVVSIRI